MAAYQPEEKENASQTNVLSRSASLMQPGDVIAFGAKGHFSEIIKFATFSDVSHVGVILQTRIQQDKTDRFFNQIIESTSLYKDTYYQLKGDSSKKISRFNTANPADMEHVRHQPQPSSTPATGA